MFQQRAEHLAYMIPSSSHVYMAQIQRAASSTLPVSHTDLTRIPRFLPRFPTRITRRLPSFPARIQRCGRVGELNQRGEDQRRRWGACDTSDDGMVAGCGKPAAAARAAAAATLSPQWKPFGASRTRNAGGLPAPETAPPPGEVASPTGERRPRKLRRRPWRPKKPHMRIGRTFAGCGRFGETCVCANVSRETFVRMGEATPRRPPHPLRGTSRRYPLRRTNRRRSARS